MGFGDFLKNPLGMDDDNASLAFDPLDLGGERGAAAAERAGDIQSRNYLLGLDLLRDQFDQSQKNLKPYLRAGNQGLNFLRKTSGVDGLDNLLNEIMGMDAFQGLREERTNDITGMLSAGGLTRSGETIEEGANIAPDLALALKNILTGDAMNLAGMGQASAVGAGHQGAQFGSEAAHLQGLSGNALGSGILGGQQATAQGQQNAIGIAAMLASFFSDPSLKQNFVKIGKVGPLDLYEWEWKPQFADTIVVDSPTIGFLSTDVKRHYPQFVGEFGGFDTVDYHGLLEELETCH